MSRPSRSSSIPIPRSSARPTTTSARNIESLISFVPFGRQPTSPSTSRPISDSRRVSHHDASRAAVSANHGTSSVSPARTTARSASSVSRRSAPRTFEPRIIRSSAGDGDSECPPSPPALPIHTRRPSMASVRTTSSSSSSQRPVIPPHIVARTGPVSFQRPAYLDHSFLRDLLHTEIPTPDIPSRRADPTISSRNQAFANAMSTPSETDDGSTVSQPTPHHQEYSFKLPTRWSDQDRHANLTVSAEGRELTLHGTLPNGEKEAAAARTTYPVPPACGIFYYEVEILGKEQKSRISIGFTGKSARSSKLPGYEPNSWAYYGDDGSTMSPERTDTQFSQSFGTGDVIGCGVDFTTYKAFFTRNGTLIGQVFENVGRNAQIYPSVGLQHTGDSIRTNFGQEPFEFDIEYHVQQQQNDVWNKILATPLDRETLQGYSKAGAGSNISITEHTYDQSSLTEEESKEALNELIMSYLVHHGHIMTARAFKKQCQNSCKEEGLVSAHLDGSDDIDLPSTSRRTDLTEADIELRTNVVNLVHIGNIDEALDLLRNHYPSVLEADKQFIFFKLRLRKFVELILGTTELKKKMRALKEREELHWKTTDPPQDSWMADEMGMDIDDDAQPPPPPPVIQPMLSTNSNSSQYAHDKYINLELGEINAQYEDALNTAISYGQELSHDYHSEPRPELQTLFRKTFGIVAWEDPSEEGSGMADIVGHQSRTALAHEINEAILKSQGRPARPPLETLYRHTATCITKLGILGVGSAAFADMAREFLQ